MSVLSDQLPRLRPADDAELRALLAEKSATDFSYPEVGASAGALPPGYRHVDRSWQLGTGRACFDAARRALFEWRVLPDWVRLHDTHAAHDAGTTAILEIHALGCYWRSGVRLLACEGRDGSARVAARSYGTLPGHHACGEERFELAQLDDDRVVYRLRSFSRWRKWLPRTLPALARRLQDRFADDSAAKLSAALDEELRS